MLPWPSGIPAWKDKSRDTRNEFAELDRLKSNFIAITSHELRTPLGLILGHATFLKEMISDEHREPMDTIIRNATRLKEIIESLTEVDNYEAGVARIRQNSISIPNIIKDVVSSFQDMAASKNITLQADLRDEDLQVEADANKITVAISNLVRNAITFTNEGGQVQVTVESVTGHVQVSVKDNGIGIPASDLPFISTVSSRWSRISPASYRYGAGTIGRQDHDRTAWWPYLGREYQRAKVALLASCCLYSPNQNKPTEQALIT